MTETMLQPTCLVCATPMAAGATPWHAVCRACGYEAAGLSPRINAPEAHAGMDEAAREKALREVRRLNFRAILARLRALPRPASATLLDVGSAHGWFLEEAAATYQVVGLEPDRQLLANSVAKGLNVREGLFPDALGEHERFGAISFHDVLEHLPDLDGALAACHRHLEDGGLLVVNLPNSRGLFYRVAKALARMGQLGPFERLWQKNLPSPHLHYFNPDNLTRLVEARGFQLQAGFALPSLTLEHLYERIAYANPLPGARLANGFVYAAIRLAYPFLTMFESDIYVGIYRKREAAASG